VVKWFVGSLLFIALCPAAFNYSAGAAETVATPAATPAPAPTATTTDIPNFSVSVSPAKSAVNIGDKIPLTITYQWPANARVVSSDGEPDITKAFSDIFVTDIPLPQKFSSGQEERRVYNLTITAHRSGAWELPRPTLTIRLTDKPGDTTSDKTRSTVAPAVIIQVGTEAAPAQLPGARAAWTRAQAPPAETSSWWIVLIIISIVLLGIILFFLLRKRAQLIVRTPWDIFSDDWQAATAAADGKEAGARLSFAVRRYVGTLFQFDGPAATSKETIHYTKKHLSDDEHRQCAKLLEQIDALRWSPDDLPPSSVRPLMDSSREWAQALNKRLIAEAEAAKLAKTEKATQAYSAALSAADSAGKNA
jgi:hypothetical protein